MSSPYLYQTLIQYDLTYNKILVDERYTGKNVELDSESVGRSIVIKIRIFTVLTPSQSFNIYSFY